MLKNYQALKDRDILLKLQPLFDSNVFYIRDDGIITHKTRLPHSTPWIHVVQAPNRNCTLLHLYYTYLGIIHSRCQECWKVVVRPRTLRELHVLWELQKTLGLPSKCGIERRDFVCGLYGGYFYNDSLEQGRECYELVRTNVDQKISPEVDGLLKRGCTEFEICKVGKGCPSDGWAVSDEQKALELRLSDLIDETAPKLKQPDHLVESTFRSFIEWAYQHGDMTYLEYTEGKPIYEPYITYHEEGA
jgi:hypothetical protein